MCLKELTLEPIYYNFLVCLSAHRLRCGLSVEAQVICGHLLLLAIPLSVFMLIPRNSLILRI